MVDVPRRVVLVVGRGTQVVRIARAAAGLDALGAELTVERPLAARQVRVAHERHAALTAVARQVVRRRAGERVGEAGAVLALHDRDARDLPAVEHDPREQVVPLGAGLRQLVVVVDHEAVGPAGVEGVVARLVVGLGEEGVERPEGLALHAGVAGAEGEAAREAAVHATWIEW